MSMTPSEKSIQRRAIQLEDSLVEIAGPAVRPIVNRLSDIRGELAADTVDHVLRICGGVLLEHDHEDLFEAIYARALELDEVKPKEARRFLFADIEP